MIHRAGTPVSFPILFSAGHPDADVFWELRDQDGVLVDSGSVTPAADAVSVAITVPAGSNSLPANELIGSRDLSWVYTILGIVVTGEERYTLEARLPFGVSADGVRTKLGVDKPDLPNNDIQLASAYLSFESAVTPDRLLALTSEAKVRVKDAVEALAALALLPTMPVRVAAKESSGTNQYQRQKIDWDAIRLSLEQQVSAAYELLIPGFDITEDFGPLLVLASPAVDALTGAETSR